MHYLKWTRDQIKGLKLAALYTEVGADGFVTREVGVDEDGQVVHIFPGHTPAGRYGYFDLALIETTGLSSDVSRDDFEAVWSRDEEGNTII